jgi:hypothetical protein
MRYFLIQNEPDGTPGHIDDAFDTLKTLVDYVEAIDVRNGEYTVLDEAGGVVTLTAAGDYSRVEATQVASTPDSLALLARLLPRWEKLPRQR